MRIERHKFDVEFARVLFHEQVAQLPRLVEGARRRASNISTVLGCATMAVSCGCVAEPNSPQLSEVFRLAADLLAAIFSTGHASIELPITVPLGSKGPVTYTAPPDESAVHVHRWKEAFWFNALVGNGEAIDRICRIHPDTLRASSSTGSEYQYLYVSALQAYRAGTPDVFDKIMEALRATDPSRSDVDDRDWALFVEEPQLECLMFLSGKDQKFGAALTRAVEAHRHYWSAKKRRREDPDGYVSFPLTAMAAMAQDRGLAFDVESPYLHHNLATMSQRDVSPNGVGNA